MLKKRDYGLGKTIRNWDTRRRQGPILRLLAAAVMVFCLGCRPKPPDFSACTKVEIKYDGGALNRFFPSSAQQQSLFNEQERQAVRSCDTWTLSDPAAIQALSAEVDKGVYQRYESGYVPGALYVIGYRGLKRKMSMVLYGTEACSRGNRLFVYSKPLAELPVLRPPGLDPLRVRWACADNLAILRVDGIRDGFTPRKSGFRYPEPNSWCDTLPGSVHNHQPPWADSAIRSVLICPGERASTAPGEAGPTRVDGSPSGETPYTLTSHYAMNPNCEPNSPPDTVLLFETKAGWNQHGGPELFTFDNHDPKGGCVILNDGTTLFIRTKEELGQLRWRN